jgi:hypothetical protein
MRPTVLDWSDVARKSTTMADWVTAVGQGVATADMLGNPQARVLKTFGEPLDPQ